MTTLFSTILSLNSEEAVSFLMQDEQYHNYELPEYFNFNLILQYVQEMIGDKSYDSCKSNLDPRQLDGVNLEFNLNKDGRYAIRPLTLCNPYLYYFMVREICGVKNWDKVKECFSHFHVPHITSCAIPVLPMKKEAFRKSTTILNWWNAVEQRSLELGLEYKYMFITDITNCYGAINPQAIKSALSMAGTTYETKENDNMIVKIKQLLADMQRGRNTGIPQGSTLFDLIAEIILGYADLLLHERIEKSGITAKYEILRYRDDYRIFCNDKGILEDISYLLQEVLFSVGFMMNSKKTKLSSDIVVDAVKEDKLAYIKNTPVFKKNGGMAFEGFQKYLMFILAFSRDYQDCGTLRTLLADLDSRIEKKLKPRKSKTKVIASFGMNTAKDVCLIDAVEADDAKKKDLTHYSDPVVNNRKIKENIKALCSIAVQIAIENNSASPYALKIISRLLSVLKDEKDLKDNILNLVREKLQDQHNAYYLQLWLQNITLSLDKQRNECPYQMPLCHLVMDEKLPVWNNDWLKASYRKGLPIGSICNQKRVQELSSEPSPVIKIVIRNAYDEISSIPNEITFAKN